MKYLVFSNVLVISLLIAACSFVTSGSFTVTIKTDKPIDMPFVVHLTHNKESEEHASAQDYAQRKIVYINSPTQFPAAKKINVHIPLKISINHPLYKSRKFSGLNFLSSSFIEKSTEYFEYMFYSSNQSNKHEIIVKIEALEEYLAPHWNEVSEKKGYSESQFEEYKFNHMSRLLNRLGSYKQQVFHAYPQMDINKIEKVYRAIINANITYDGNKNVLLKKLENKLGL